MGADQCVACDPAHAGRDRVLDEADHAAHGLVALRALELRERPRHRHDVARRAVGQKARRPGDIDRGDVVARIRVAHELDHGGHGQPGPQPRRGPMRGLDRRRRLACGDRREQPDQARQIAAPTGTLDEIGIDPTPRVAGEHRLPRPQQRDRRTTLDRLGERVPQPLGVLVVASARSDPRDVQQHAKRRIGGELASPCHRADQPHDRRVKATHHHAGQHVDFERQVRDRERCRRLSAGRAEARPEALDVDRPVPVVELVLGELLGTREQARVLALPPLPRLERAREPRDGHEGERPHTMVATRRREPFHPRDQTRARAWSGSRLRLVARVTHTVVELDDTVERIPGIRRVARERGDHGVDAGLVAGAPPVAPVAPIVTDRQHQ